MAHTFHLLTESEPFSEFDGGAVSRWTANVLRDDENSTVLAPYSDSSWGFPRHRVRDLPDLVHHKRFLDRGWHRLPWVFRLEMLRRVLGPALDDLVPGDTVWIHGRPEFAAALQPFVHARGAKLVLHLHNSHLVQWSRRVTTKVHADRYVFCSRYLQQEALGVFPNLGDTTVVGNGANPSLFHPALGGSKNAIPVVLFASRIVPEKGLHVFLEAMRLLEARGVGLEGVVVGGAGFGNSAPTVYLQAMQAKRPANVRFEPYCVGPALAQHFRAADMFCLPSCWDDPFPLATLEAMASGLPVVATRSGGIPEQLALGGGILVERNSAEELADALAALVLDRRWRLQLSAEAYAAFQTRFTWASVRKQYQEALAGTTLQPATQRAPALEHTYS